MLEIVLTPKTLGLLPKLWAPPKSGALGLSLSSLMVNPRVGPRRTLARLPWQSIYFHTPHISYIIFISRTVGASTITHRL